MGDPFLLVVLVQVTGRLREGRVRPATEHHPIFLLGHRRHDRSGVLAEGLTGHAAADGEHHVGDQVGIVVDGGNTIQEFKGPAEAWY